MTELLFASSVILFVFTAVMHWQARRSLDLSIRLCDLVMQFLEESQAKQTGGPSPEAAVITDRDPGDEN